MKIKVSKTFNTITPESAEQGDFSESGFVYEDKTMTVKELLQEVKDLGSYEWSSSQPSHGDWITQADPDRDYKTGEETYESLHFLDGLKTHQAQRIIKILKALN
jgi:hypothetical protein